MKRWISVLLVCVFMIGILPADALAVEDQFTMTDAQVQQISKLAGSETSTYRKGMSFSASMSAYQMYCWLSELSENAVAQAQRQFSSLSRLLAKNPEFKEKPGFERLKRFPQMSTA